MLYIINPPQSSTSTSIALTSPNTRIASGWVCAVIGIHTPVMYALAFLVVMFLSRAGSGSTVYLELGRGVVFSPCSLAREVT